MRTPRPFLQLRYVEKVMQIELNSKSVREMADRVVRTHTDMSKSTALEVLAHAFGQRNFDTLSGLLNSQAAQSLNQGAEAQESTELAGLKLPVTLWLECHMREHYGSGPRWARLVITQEWLESVLALRARCRQWGSSVVQEDGPPTEWDEQASTRRCFNMQDSQLCVSQERFWFQAHPKHSDCYVETRAIYLDDLLALLKAGSGGENTFCWAGGALYRDAHSVLELFDALPGNAAIDWDLVEEWVGLHYGVNFDNEPMMRQLDWVLRYQESHAE